MALSRFEGTANHPTGSTCIDHDQSCLLRHPSLWFLVAPSKEVPAPNQASADPLTPYLERLASLVLDALSDYNGLSSPVLETHVASSVVIDQQGARRMVSRKEFLAFRAEEMKHMPNYKFEIKHATTLIHEGRRTATMWLLKRLSGLSCQSILDLSGSQAAPRNGICKESVACTKWELKGNTWVCTRLNMVRGVAHGSNCEL